MTTSIKKLVITNCLECPFSTNDTFADVETVKADVTREKFKNCKSTCEHSHYVSQNKIYTCDISFATDNIMWQCPLQDNDEISKMTRRELLIVLIDKSVDIIEELKEMMDYRN